MPDPQKQTTLQPTTRAKRTLVGEILYVQLGYAFVIGMVAIVLLWSGATWIIGQTMSEMAQRWTEDLGELGGEFMAESNNDRYLRIERYVAKFPEIAYLRYYDQDGELTFLETGINEIPTTPELTADHFEAIKAASTDGSINPIEEAISQSGIRISVPILVTSISAGEMMSAASLSELSTRSTLVGFLEMGLDYSRYSERLNRYTYFAGSLITLAFLLLALLGRLSLRRALQPLRDIQEPLAQLARGETNIHVGKSAHREIETIMDSLNYAVETIHQRDEHLRYLATYDDLTGLPNRYAFMSYLKEILLKPEQDAVGTVLFVDLDQFKYVNDTLGHMAGDHLLKQVASRIKASVGKAGYAARFGGDEFSVILPAMTAAESLEFGEKLSRSLSDFPFVAGKQSFNLTCSMGIASLDQSIDKNSDDILAFADLACQLAKSNGRNRIQVYEPSAGAIETIKYDIGWSKKLSLALKNDSFVLHYQPILNIESGSASHYEVLLRVNDEDGLQYPGAFLSAAERFGLMSDIDRWVIEHALQNLAWFRRQIPNLRFTINVSGSAFANGDLVQFVQHHLRENALAPNAIIFEVTEQVAVENFAEATSQISQLIDLGCEIALDDFGAGYSSFTYLKHLPVQYVKIDGQFIKEMHTNSIDQAMVQAISDVAKALGKKTIAEFVENEAILKLLAEMDIDYAQGFFVGKPGARLASQYHAEEPMEVATDQTKMI